MTASATKSLSAVCTTKWSECLEMPSTGVDSFMTFAFKEGAARYSKILLYVEATKGDSPLNQQMLRNNHR